MGGDHIFSEVSVERFVCRVRTSPFFYLVSVLSALVLSVPSLQSPVTCDR
jgi:hypothetical protein